MSDETDETDATVPLKSCSTCEHRSGAGTYARCMNSGYFCEVERKASAVCGRHYAGWIPRRGLFARISGFFAGAAK
jgi:hypothetical protein